jgi:cell division protein FtsI (penicillin-binding protein 3)
MSRSVRYTSSPLLTSPTPLWRSKLVVAAIALAFFGLVARAAYIQVVDNAFFQRQGEVRFERKIELPANRGQILDRHGRILASSVPASSIWAIPEDVELEKDSANLQKLAQLLGVPWADLLKKLEQEDKTFVWVKRQVDVDVAKQIAALQLKGIYQRQEYKRQYPEGEAMAHVVGFTNVEDVGQEGIELLFNKTLVGKPGERHVIKNRLGQAVQDVGDNVLPQDGAAVQLSIDSKIQFIAYQKIREAVLTHKAQSGSVVVLDAHSGEVLALTNFPSYSPDERKNLSGAQLRNRALTDTFEPGSVMKPFTVGLALETHRVKPTTVIDTAPGAFTVNGATIRDSHPHGALTVEQVIALSSNVGTAKIAMQIPASEMWETFSQAGFGQKPKIEFPGAVAGRLRPANRWRPIEQATISYGYGLSASLFQMARSYTVFSNDGEIIPTTLMKNELPAPGVRVFSTKTAEDIRSMLKLAASAGGTAQKAQTMGYSVGGKSGTAYKQVGKGYGTDGKRKYRSWFVGMAPINSPRIIVAVMVDEPSAGKYYGGDVAAPVFSETVQQTLRMLNVPPDMAVRPDIVATAVEESF